jgi:hypothetical protein
MPVSMRPPSVVRSSLVPAVLAAACTLGGWTGVADGCPVTRDQLRWDGRDGQLSVDLSIPVSLHTRAADDFVLPLGNGHPWDIRRVEALMVSDTAPPLAQYSLEIYADGPPAAGMNYLPGSLEFAQMGASSVADMGEATAGYRIYRVTFELGAGVCSLAPNRWHWVSVFGRSTTYIQTFLATSGAGAITGSVAAASLNYPTDPWRTLGADCCIAATDLAFLVRAVQQQSLVSDYNCSGVVSVQDLFDFLHDYFGGLHAADINGGGLSVQDLFDFLAMYFGGQ